MDRQKVKAVMRAVASGAMQAFADGKPVQWRYIGHQSWNDEIGDDPYFVRSDMEWRPAPEPERKTITPEEAFDLWGVVICDSEKQLWRVTDPQITEIVVTRFGLVHRVKFQQLLTDGWTHNGEPICSRL